LSSAWHAAKSGLGKVVLIESEIIGFGASGRAAGWIMPQFGMDQLSIRKTYGVERSRAAFAYCRRATA
ncbi:FAD-dependent oxidoreductase, partial [Vibrio parahaemolyticus]